ncbi:MAG: Gfo/Idh/MocA family oxidoreductase [Ignavibacteriota bacterium]
MAVEACKAGKDVYVEKPACKGVDEGLKMVQAARKYNRVVQAGTMQRSGGNFRKAAELVASGTLGEITFCHTFQSELTPRVRYGNLPDAPVPDGLDWDMWLGPAPAVPFNPNRWGQRITFPTFRYFWDYAGGAMTDWGVHLIDPLHQCFGEAMPKSVAAMGEKFYVTDNCDTPDTMHVTFEYPRFLVTYESRTCNSLPLFGLNQGVGTSIHGTEGTLVVNRRGVWVIPNANTRLSGATWENIPDMTPMNVPHWKNFVSAYGRDRSPRATSRPACGRRPHANWRTFRCARKPASIGTRRAGPPRRKPRSPICGPNIAAPGSCKSRGMAKSRSRPQTTAPPPPTRPAATLWVYVALAGALWKWAARRR